ncbi:MAG: sulfatase-like hydrolase/transferase [Anaerolineae bacterium]|nr:sulfatase-like hydrolase/transferase [Anaerolineae bacterium]
MSVKRPNIVLFTTDQQRGDFFGLAGHPLVETPNLDSLVQHGLYFPNAYSEIPSTTGARRILLSGKGNYHCGLVGYSATEWHEPNTLAHVLADNGYHCFNVGFRNLHPVRKLYGFHEVSPGELDHREWLRARLGPWAHERSHGVDANGWTARPWDKEEQYHRTNWTTEVAMDMLRRRDPTRPFFLWVSHHAPHSPYDPPGAIWDMYADREQPPVPVGDWAERYDVAGPGLPVTAWHGRLTPEQTRRGRIGYMGLITHIDFQFGYMLEEWRRSRLAQDTLFVYTADHGDMLGDHHLHRKTYAYEGSARIPFVIGYPQGYEGPTGTCDRVVGLQDVMPTILEVAEVEPPPGMTGRSALAAARGEPWREFLHGEHSPCYALEPAMHYLTDGKRKYIWFPATDEEQFFDLESDRQELRNLAGDPGHADEVARWRERLVQVLAERGDGFSDGRRLLPRREWWGPEAK